MTNCRRVAANGHRKKSINILKDPSITTMLVEHRDRLVADYTETALDTQARQLVVVDPSEVDDDRVRDITEMSTSLCARLCGQRSAANKAKKAVEITCEGGR